ncbi:MAG TPA: RNase H [Mogibacterium sp.]|nr:RNase H [Mogibacterium sp.]
MARKLYAVKKGRTTGLLMTWDECKTSVEGFPNAEYKSFTDIDEALAYLGLARNIDLEDKNSVGNNLIKEEKLPPGIRAYVDGSYDDATKRFSCGAVIVKTDEKGNSDIEELSSVFDDEEFAKHRNVAGEVMGAKLAIKHCLENSIDSITICHDYEGIEKWANGLWKANALLTQDYKAYIADARQKIKIDFIKIKAHSGDKYNEMADKLAKQALNM